MIRVFPRKTNATPSDEKVYLTGPPLNQLEDRNVHVSCVFTWDRSRAESLAKQWEVAGYDVKIGGPAYDDPGGDFVPGRYISKGHVMTSRGCNNKCWFCFTPKREGRIKELPIVDGWRVLDSNLLQCSKKHIVNVFSMLKRQFMPSSFLGGLEARLLNDWHIALMQSIVISRCYFAYDEPDDIEPLAEAAKKLWAAGYSSSSHRFSCYVLVGYKSDTFVDALGRINAVMKLGLVPFAMLYRDEQGYRDPDWISFQAQWANPVKIYGKKKQEQYPLLEKEA